MKLAIMQPYFFPYIGYFQLLDAVETFVIYDDVNYIRQGWINRNNILLNGNRHLFTLALKGASSFKLINQIEIGDNGGNILKTICQAYRKAPRFEEVYPLVERAIKAQEKNLSRYVEHGIRLVCDHLGINTNFIRSSDIEKDNSLAGQDKILQICKLLGAGEYINAIGGRSLYSRKEFGHNNIRLRFIKTGAIVYKQFGDDFVPNLSIIDVMMFNDRDEIKKLLANYELL